MPSSDFSFLLTRYLAAVGLTCIFYDHALTLDNELKYIWKRGQWDFIKFYFTWNRYFAEAGLMLGAYLSAGDADNFTTANCKALTVAVSTMGIVSLAGGTATVTWKVYTIWDQRRSALLALAIAFVITYSGVLVSFVISLKYVDNETWALSNKACIIQRPSAMIGIWASLTAFNVFAFILAIANAFDKPYRQNIQVMARLRRDGAFFFVWMTTSCVLNLVVYFIGGPFSTFYFAFVAWALDSVALSRLVLEFEAVKARVYTSTQPCIAFHDMHEMNSFSHT